MSSDRRTDHPALVHRLVVAFHFVDAFSQREIDRPLEVSAPTIPFASGIHSPRLPWSATPFRNIYRFQTTNEEALPPATIDFQVADPSGAYAAFERISVGFPVPVSTPPSSSDFLREISLWPTRKFGAVSGETAAVISVRSAGATDIAGLQVRVWKHTGGAAPSTPYTYTDARGEALFRLLGPDFKRTASGGTTVDVDVELRAPPLFTATVPISTPSLPITIDLATSNVLFLDVP